jgi:hypothetical protein
MGELAELAREEIGVADLTHESGTLRRLSQKFHDVNISEEEKRQTRETIIAHKVKNRMLNRLSEIEATGRFVTKICIPYEDCKILMECCADFDCIFVTTSLRNKKLQLFSGVIGKIWGAEICVGEAFKEVEYFTEPY